MAYSLCGMLAAIPIFFMIYAAVKGEIELSGYLIASILSVGFILFGAIFLVDTSDLLVDDTGLARRIMGGICTQIPWSGIKGIREMFRTNVRNGPQIIIQIMPCQRRDLILRFRRKIVVTDEIVGFNELLEILNARIHQYSIRVEINSNGIWSERSRLATTP
jgi:hypothetical protein